MAEPANAPEQYPSNSRKSKDSPADDAPKVEKVVTGAVTERKQSVFRRFRNNMVSEDGQGVLGYVFFTVILPQAKDMFYDIGNATLQRVIFGDKASGGYTPARRGYTAYGAMSAAKQKNPSSKTSAIVNVPSDQFTDIIVETRADAQAVMDAMENLMDQYGSVSISDLKAAVGNTGKFTDEQFGWTSLVGTDIRRVGGTNPGFMLIFPRPVPLD